MSRGVLLVISGFSGSGKGTVIRELLEGGNKRPDCCLSISATSRGPRTGEKDGREYYFKTKEEFEAMIEADQFLEYAEYVGNYYGTPRQYVMEQLDKGMNVILEIEVQGALLVKKKFPQAALIFITPPDSKTLEERLRGRQTEPEEVIKGRLDKAAREAMEIGSYDYIVINDKVDDCVKRISELIDVEKRKAVNQPEMIKNLQADMQRLCRKDRTEGEAK